MTRRKFLAAGSLAPVLRFAAAAPTSPSDYPAAAVPLTQVEIRDEFWAPRIEANRTVSIWHCFEHLHDDGDFNLSKLIEGAAYILAKQPDPRLQSYTEERIAKLLAAMEARIADPTRAVHVSGHFLEAAAAWQRVTGQRKMLDAALRDFDSIATVYGPGKQVYISGHEGQKIGLVALYRATGDPKYWQLAKFFLDQRGRDDYPRSGEYALDRTYAQDHEPVVRQAEAVGHCVRATFLYIALADIAALTGAPEYARALRSIWEDAAYRKMYVTGGIGSIRFHEQFGAPYELPNLSGWNETCAAYGNVAWNHRMFLLHEDAEYIDVMERVLYNTFAAGVSLKGDRFFYQNPLKSFGNYERFEWIDTPCCPPNVVRLMASLGSYIYAVSPRAIYVNLFVAGSAMVDGVKLTQETRYPRDGDVTIQVDPGQTRSFTVAVRIPGWAQNQVVRGLDEFIDDPSPRPTISVNDRAVRMEPQRGYILVDREWRNGDRIELHLPMPIRQVRANSFSKEDRDRVALQRGPLVYCVEWVDNEGHALNIMLPPGTALKTESEPELFGGVETITGRGVILGQGVRQFTAVPYHAWNNRGMGEMQVWIGRGTLQAWVAPAPPSPIVHATASGELKKIVTGYNDQNDDLSAVYDGAEPISSADESSLYFRMRPAAGEPAWIEYELRRPTGISTAQVYFFDDRRFCRLPAAWRILYKEGEQWKPVANRAAYTVQKDQFNITHFDPVLTAAIRLEIEPRNIEYKSGQVGPPGAMILNQDIQWREAGVLEFRIS
jgi:uncharacterized protein